MIESLTALREYRALAKHAHGMRDVSLRELFAADEMRGERYTIEAAGLYFDYSKNRITDESVNIMIALAHARNLVESRAAMFGGAPINQSEERPALHVALRMGRQATLVVDGVDVIPLVHSERDRMADLARAIRSGERKGHSGRAIRAIVNIGIGGSDLGPEMVLEALHAYADPSLTVRFISNVDASDLRDSTIDLDPEETLFIVSSKSFSTYETIVNARSAREWITRHYRLDGATGCHFVAITNNATAAEAFGINRDEIFGLWDWVGGRYSICSAIGLSAMIAVGPERFDEMVAGFRAMDEHFCDAPVETNMPVIHGLLTFFYTQFFGAQTIGVMPYERYLGRFPAYLQQLTMESNGKGVTSSGESVDYATGPIYWGETGTNAQHSFFQLLHQGTHLVPLDLIGFVNSPDPHADHHEVLSANLFAQAEALAFGRNARELASEAIPEGLVPHKVMAGDRPTNVILAKALTPSVLGALIALYEHSVFTQGVLLGINSFDQWGVEFGKALADRILPELEGTDEPRLRHDSSTNALIRRFRELRTRD